MSHLLEKIHGHFIKGLKNETEANMFFKKALWNNEDYFDIKYNRLLDPHIKDYFSPLNPGFLYQLKEADVLTNFKVFMARDGLAGLSYFFLRNEVPPSPLISLLIPASLGYLVPKAWLDQCAFYRTRSIINEPKRPKILFLDGCVLSECLDKDELSKKLDLVLAKYHVEKVKLSLSFSTQFKWNHQLYAETTLFAETLQLIQEKFSQKIDLITPDKLFNQNIANGVYVNLNSRPFWYYDSYVKYNILETGAYNFDSQMEFEGQVLTFDHGLFQKIDIVDQLPARLYELHTNYFSDLEKNREMQAKEKYRTRNLTSLEDIEMVPAELRNLLIHHYKNNDV